MIPTVYEVSWKFFYFFVVYFFRQGNALWVAQRRREEQLSAYFTVLNEESAIRSSHYLHISIYHKQHMQEQCKKKSKK